MSDSSLLLLTAAAVVLLVVLIARLRVHAFIALTLVAFAFGIASGREFTEVAKAFEAGLGGMLGGLAMVIGLGSVLGALLAESRGAEKLASTVAGWFGAERLHWIVAVIAFVIGVPVFFGVGVVILIPVIYQLARKAEAMRLRAPLLLLGMPLVAGLSFAHGFVPPHPGPLAAIAALEADVGRTIGLSLLIGFVTTMAIGPLAGKWFARWVSASEMPKDLPPEAVDPKYSSQRPIPSFGMTLFTISLPVLLMMTATVGDWILPPENPARRFLAFLGNPTVSMLLAVLWAFYALGWKCRFTRHQILAISSDCLGPVAAILLVVGAGGGFNRVIIASGVGAAVQRLVTPDQMEAQQTAAEQPQSTAQPPESTAETNTLTKTPAARAFRISPLILGWLFAAAIRVATGSATVAITAAAGFMAPLVEGANVDIELLVLAMGAGSLTLSHVNDGGFWIVREYLRLSVAQTLRTWTVVETLGSFVALAIILLLNLILHGNI